ncbi:MAG: FHA domain-containing protein, partial [Myxococcales bacterium]|nr:FHA domain-containing protein [Myxococcales bacterium]
RLRFLLQEIDLSPGVTVLGRSPTCHVTLDDPLVSREHAQLSVRGNQVTVQDLGSRNGTLVNGEKLAGTQELRDGDRVRLGTQELVFYHLDDADRAAGRATGFMTRCAACGVPYPAEAGTCPNCGSDHRVEDDTVSGVVGATDQNWTLQLLIEVLQRAETVNRTEDVERLLERARANIEGRLAANHHVAPEHLDAVAVSASRLARRLGNARWGRWALDVFAAANRLPPEVVSVELHTLPPDSQGELRGSVERILAEVTEESAERRQALLRLAADLEA